MSKIAIVVEFRIKEGQHGAFDSIIREHARLTKQEEPGCDRFDVLQPRGRDGKPDLSRIMLCEVYASDAAVTAHTQNPRLATVREAYTPLIDGRTLTMCEM